MSGVAESQVYSSQLVPGDQAIFSISGSRLTYSSSQRSMPKIKCLNALFVMCMLVVISSVLGTRFSGMLEGQMSSAPPYSRFKFQLMAQDIRNGSPISSGMADFESPTSNCNASESVALSHVAQTSNFQMEGVDLQMKTLRQVVGGLQTMVNPVQTIQTSSADRQATCTMHFQRYADRMQTVQKWYAGHIQTVRNDIQAAQNKVQTVWHGMPSKRTESQTTDYEVQVDQQSNQTVGCSTVKPVMERGGCAMVLAVYSDLQTIMELPKLKAEAMTVAQAAKTSLWTADMDVDPGWWTMAGNQIVDKSGICTMDPMILTHDTQCEG